MRIALGAQLAGRAGAAAITPIVPLAALAAIAGVGVLDDEIDERLAAERVRQRPGLGLGQPHQRRLDLERHLRAEPDRLLERAQGRVAAIRIAGIVRLAHAADERMQSAPVAERRRIGEEHEIAPRHEGRRQAGGEHLDLGAGGERGLADGAEARDVDHMVRPEPRAPGWETRRRSRAARVCRHSSSTAWRWP